MIKSNTLITTINGQKRVDQITKDDLILSYDIETGSIVYKHPIILYKIQYEGMVIQLNDLNLANLNYIMDFDMNAGVIIDSSLKIIHPKLFQLKVLAPDLTPQQNSPDIKFVQDKDYYYNLSVEDTDFYFANNCLMSNTDITSIFEKRNDQFLTIKFNYNKLLSQNIQDNQVKNIFARYNLTSDLIEGSYLKYIPGCFYFIKNYYGEHCYQQSLFKLNQLLKAFCQGVRIL